MGEQPPGTYSDSCQLVRFELGSKRAYALAALFQTAWCCFFRRLMGDTRVPARYKLLPGTGYLAVSIDLVPDFIIPRGRSPRWTATGGRAGERPSRPPPAGGGVPGSLLPRAVTHAPPGPSAAHLPQNVRKSPMKHGLFRVRRRGLETSHPGYPGQGPQPEFAPVTTRPTWLYDGRCYGRTPDAADRFCQGVCCHGCCPRAGTREWRTLCTRCAW